MRVKPHFAVAGLLLLVGAVTANRCGSADPKPGDLEVPPSFSSLVDNAQTVTFCELVREPERFSNKVVRTEAIFHSNQENTELCSADCDDPKNCVWADFDASYDYSEESVKKNFRELLCKQVPCPSGEAKIMVAGRFEGSNGQSYGHLNGYRFRFVIMRIIRAEATVVRSNDE